MFFLKILLQKKSKIAELKDVNLDSLSKGYNMKVVKVSFEDSDKVSWFKKTQHRFISCTNINLLIVTFLIVVIS